MTTETRRRDEVQIALDLGMQRVARDARLLPALTPDNAAAERARLVTAFEAGRKSEPEWRMPDIRVARDTGVRIDKLRRVAETQPGAALYLAKLDELELDLALLSARSQPKLVRPLSARRFGTGHATAPGRTDVSLREVAADLLAHNEPGEEDKTVPARSQHAQVFTLEHLMAHLGLLLGMEIEVQVSAKLMSNAAAGEHTVFIANRTFGLRESLRLAVHEVMGHLVSAFNGRAQPLGIFALGTAGSFADQEGVCITLEERAGLLDADRVRTFAARVLVTDWVHDGASFAETVTRLTRDYGFEIPAAVSLAERGHRGGGVTRDAVYLRSWMRVRRATEEAIPLDLLRIGKVGVDDVATLRALAAEGWLRLQPPFLGDAPATYLPSLLSSSVATGVGTSFEMSPPNLQTSFTSPDAT